jgi:hypothetical protein
LPSVDPWAYDAANSADRVGSGREGVDRALAAAFRQVAAVEVGSAPGPGRGPGFAVKGLRIADDPS